MTVRSEGFTWEIFDPVQSIPPTLDAGAHRHRQVLSARICALQSLDSWRTRYPSAQASVVAHYPATTERPYPVGETVWDSEHGFAPGYGDKTLAEVA